LWATATKDGYDGFGFQTNVVATHYGGYDLPAEMWDQREAQDVEWNYDEMAFDWGFVPRATMDAPQTEVVYPHAVGVSVMDMSTGLPPTYVGMRPADQQPVYLLANLLGGLPDGLIVPRADLTGSPRVPHWTCTGTHLAFIVNDQPAAQADGMVVQVRTLSPSESVGDCSITVTLDYYLWEGCPTNLTATISNTAPVTVFQSTLSGAVNQSRALNSDDDGPSNTRSDIRDSGKISGVKTVCQTPDPGISAFTVSILPNVAPLNTAAFTTDFSVVNGGDKIAIWDDNLRTNGEVTAKTFTNDQLPATLYLEAVRPEPLDSEENFIDTTILRATCTVQGSQSIGQGELTTYIVPKLTAYTTPHECEYSGATTPITVYSPDKSVSVQYATYTGFTGDAAVEGFGYLTNLLTIDGVSYRYIEHTHSDGSWRGAATEETATGTAPGNTSTAKCKLGPDGNPGALSAFSLRGTVYIPRLRTGWLTWPSIDALVNRNVDDVGPGKGSDLGKWLDIYIPYKPSTDQQRVTDFGQASWQDIIANSIETRSNLKAHFD
jgi:hypothetical protein